MSTNTKRSNTGIRKCMFETNRWNSNTRKWERLDVKKYGLRMCLQSTCTSVHLLNSRPKDICPKNTECNNAGVTCMLLHDFKNMKPLCKYKDNCLDTECTEFRHPDNRTTEVCELKDECPNVIFKCRKLHPLKSYPPVCSYKADCINCECKKLHPDTRPEVCPNGSECRKAIFEDNCELLHPKFMQKACKYGEDCHSESCRFAH